VSGTVIDALSHQVLSGVQVSSNGRSRHPRLRCCRISR
jgi:hypothetical protein